jgi:hypothetical protein
MEKITKWRVLNYALNQFYNGNQISKNEVDGIL